MKQIINSYRNITLILILFDFLLIEISHWTDFNKFQNKTRILEIDNTKLFITSGLVKTRIKIIHTICYVNLYFLVKCNTHWKYFSA